MASGYKNIYDVVEQEGTLGIKVLANNLQEIVEEYPKAVSIRLLLSRVIILKDKIKA